MTSQFGDQQPHPASSFAKLTTSSVPIVERLDFWREQFVSCEITRPEPGRKKAFNGELVVCPNENGPAFAKISGDPLVCSFGKRESGRMLLGYVRAGTFHVKHDDERTTVLNRRSGLVLFDCDRPLVTSSTDYDLVHLMLPRSLVMGALGGGGGGRLRDKAMIELPRGGLTPVLLAQLDAMATYGVTFSRTETAAVMQSATSLSVALLSGLAGSIEIVNEFDNYLFIAARRYIDAHASRHDLTAGGIAAAVGCSRAHLYRLFADRSMAVASVLRDVRLGRARLLIETNARRPIGAIAFDCGYSDLSAFGKAFRRHYGMTPGECRAQAVVSQAASLPSDATGARSQPGRLGR